MSFKSPKWNLPHLNSLQPWLVRPLKRRQKLFSYFNTYYTTYFAHITYTYSSIAFKTSLKCQLHWHSSRICGAPKKSTPSKLCWTDSIWRFGKKLRKNRQICFWLRKLQPWSGIQSFQQIYCSKHILSIGVKRIFINKVKSLF